MQPNANVEELIQRTANRAVASFVEQQRGPNNSGQNGPKCYACNKFRHIAAKCTSHRSDANALGKDIQEPPSIDELFGQEEKDEYFFDLPHVDTKHTGQVFRQFLPLLLPRTLRQSMPISRSEDNNSRL